MSEQKKINIFIFPIRMKLILFDRMVKPILTYCLEAWGIYNFKEVYKLHYKFCKILLGFKTQTPNLDGPFHVNSTRAPHLTISDLNHFWFIFALIYLVKPCKIFPLNFEYF